MEAEWCDLKNYVKISLQEKYSFLKDPWFLKFGLNYEFLYNMHRMITERFLGDLSENNYLPIASNEKLLLKFSSTEKIFIYGDADLGESFMLMNILSLWINDKFPPNFLLLYINQASTTAEDTIFEAIVNQNSKRDCEVNENALKKFLDATTKEYEKYRIILLLDDTNDESDNSIDVEHLINGHKSFNHPIIIWSRRSRAKTAIEKYDLIMEFIGLKHEDLKIFFQQVLQQYDKTLKGNGESESLQLLSYLENERKSLLKLCRNPIFAVFVLITWSKYGKSLKNELTVIQKIADLTIENNEEEINKEIGRKCLEFLLYNKKPCIPTKLNSMNSLKAFINTKINSKNNKSQIFEFNHGLLYFYFAAKYFIILHKLMNKDEIGDDELLKFYYKTYKRKNIIKLKKMFEFIKELDIEVYNEISKVKECFIPILEENNTNLLKELQKTKKVLKFVNVRLNSQIFRTILNFQLNSVKEIILENAFFDFEDFFCVLKLHPDVKVTHFRLIYSDKIIFNDQNLLEVIKNALPSLEYLYLKNLHFEHIYKDCPLIFSKSWKIFSLQDCSFKRFPSQILLSNCSEIDISRTNFSGKLFFYNFSFTVVNCKFLQHSILYL